MDERLVKIIERFIVYRFYCPQCHYAFFRRETLDALPCPICLTKIKPDERNEHGKEKENEPVTDRPHTNNDSAETIHGGDASTDAGVKKAVVEKIVTEDALGLVPGLPLKLNQAQAWRFLTEAGKVDAFNVWLQEQVDTNLLSPVTGAGEVLGPLAGQPWTAKYVDSAYKKGKVRAFTDTHAATLAGSPDFYQGTKAQFLQQAFSSPEAISKLQLIYTRTFEELKGVTAVMSQQLSRALVNGLAAGQNPVEIARQMTNTIDGITRTRALTLARTEVIHAHAEGQLDSFEELGVEEVGLLAEWSTAGDDLVCPLCLPLEGTILTIKEARGLIPRHPNCRCMWIPANVGEKHGGQAWNDAFIGKKFRASIRAEKPKATAAEARAGSMWLGKTKKISSKTKLKLPTVGGKPVNKPIEAGDKVVTPPTPSQTGPVIPKKAGPAPKPTPPPKPIRKAPARPRVPTPKPELDVTTQGIAQGFRVPYAGDIEIISEQIGGSTGAKLVSITNPRTGRKRKFIMKQYSGNQTQVNNEFMANRLYNNMKGGSAARSYIGRYKGNQVLFSDYIDDIDMQALSDVVGRGGSDLLAAQKAISDNFVADAWLANWDSVGLRYDNIGLAKGKWVRVDNGGSLLFRAQGSPKGSLFTDTVGEISSLRNASRNPQAAKIFGKITDKQLLKHMDNFEARVRRAGGVDDLIKSVTDHVNISSAESNEIARKLRARYSDIIRQRDLLRIELEAPKVVYSPKVANKLAGKRYNSYSDLSDESHRVSNLISDKERRAIRRFTASDYGDINEKVLEDRITSTAKSLDSGLDKHPGYLRHAFRGQHRVSVEQWDNWTTGGWAHVDWKGYSSSSIRPGSEFSSGRNGVGYLIKNKGRQGRYVEAVSDHGHERELLFKRGSKFRVIGWGEVAEDANLINNKHSRILYIEELDDHAQIPVRQAPPKKYEAEDLYQLFRNDAKDAGVS